MFMWSVTDDDFERIRTWGLQDDPMRAVADFSWEKAECRWLNPEQRIAVNEYIKARNNYIQAEDFDNYYQTAKKPIDKGRWQYLMERKAWYIIPLNWVEIAESGGKVVDLGCGDGDTVQRLIDFVAKYWSIHGIEDKTLEIVGVDLNHSRIENARTHVVSPSSNIIFEFHQSDIVRRGLSVANSHFDFGLCCGVLEILDDIQFSIFLEEMCRVVRQGIYIEDLYERFPGGYPRDNLGQHLIERGFVVTHKKIVMSEPYDPETLQDPKKIWPNFLDQILWASAMHSEKNL